MSKEKSSVIVKSAETMTETKKRAPRPTGGKLIRLPDELAERVESYKAQYGSGARYMRPPSDHDFLLHLIDRGLAAEGI